MKAMVLKHTARLEENPNPLELATIPDPLPGDDEILVKISACGVCRTELDEIEGRTPPARLPIVPGHQIVGRVIGRGSKARRFKLGERVGIGWIFSACGRCRFCLAGNENLCDDFRGTGRDADGGYAQYTVVPEDYAQPIPEAFSDAQAAPLLCAGAVGFRSLRLTGMEDGKILGLVGFGASAHLVLQMARKRYPRSRIFVFARSPEEREFARELGAHWAGDMDEAPPEKLHAAIDTTPAWRPIVQALDKLEKGGRLVINAIRKEDRDKEALLRLDYAGHLWLEKEIKSVANVSRADLRDFLHAAGQADLRPQIQEFRLEEANQALRELKERKIRGAKVLKID